MTDRPLMARATAVWLIDHTTLNFRQVGEFCGMHELEVQGIADGDVAQGVKGFDPVANNQLLPEEIKLAEADPSRKLRLKFNPASVGEEKRRGPRYTPLSKRQDRPAAIYWLVRFHPELSDAQIGKLVGTTKPTILAIRERSHWNIQNIDPIDPVALGLCKQSELDAAVFKASEKKNQDAVMSDDERRKLVSTQVSLSMSPEPRMPSSMAGLGSFSLGGQGGDEEEERRTPMPSIRDADAFFKLPAGGGDDEDEDERPARR